MIARASLLSLLCFLSPAVTRAQLPSGKILWLTDIGLDINPGIASWNGSRFGQFGEDTSVPLWAATIRSIRTLESNPDFIVVTGNSVTGNLRNISTDGVFVDPVETLRAVTVALQSFTGVRSFFALGPNDVIEHINRKQIYLSLAKMWQPWIGDDAQTLALFGYYTSQINNDVTLLALNTNLFLEEQTDFSDIAAQAQISWLRRELDRVGRARGSAIIIGHTPPGVDDTGLPRWSENFQDQFIDLIQEQSGMIKMMLFGGTHSDAFQLVAQSKKWSEGRFAKSALRNNPDQQNVILMAPSLAPWRNPNHSPSSPAFRVLDYSRVTGELVDVHQFFMDLTLSNQLDAPIWSQLYTFRSAYGIRPVNGDSMLDVFNRLSNNDQLLSEFIDRQGAVNTTKSCDSLCRRRLLCSIEHMRSVDWLQCVLSFSDAPDERYLTYQAWVPIVAGAILLLFVVSLFIYFGARAVKSWCGYKRFA